MSGDNAEAGADSPNGADTDAGSLNSAEAAEAASEPVVLIVDNEERITQAFRLWLDDRYDVRTATSGEEAFERLDETVDVVLLDRQMPGFSGREVLDHIHEEGYDCRVAMVTGVDPGFDVVDMPFDDYVQKPVDRTELREVVERLLSLNAYESLIQEYFSGARKQAALEAEKPQSILQDSEAYAELRDRVDWQGERMSEALRRLNAEQLDDLLRDLVGVELPEPTTEE